MNKPNKKDYGWEEPTIEDEGGWVLEGGEEAFRIAMEFFQEVSGMKMEYDYDSELDTLKHIKTVNAYLIKCAKILMDRAIVHDDSKLKEPEKSVFDEMTPKLKESTYGSDEYKGFLNEMKVALDHHYGNNSHHPEHYEDGIWGMDLFDLIEMVVDWKAATERHDDGNIVKSLKINKDRFNISDQLYQILFNTIKRMFIYPNDIEKEKLKAVHEHQGRMRERYKVATDWFETKFPQGLGYLHPEQGHFVGVNVITNQFIKEFLEVYELSKSDNHA